MFVYVCVDDGSHTCFLVLTWQLSHQGQHRSDKDSWRLGSLWSARSRHGEFSTIFNGVRQVPFSMASIPDVQDSDDLEKNFEVTIFQILLRIWCCLGAIWVHASANPHGFGFGGLDCIQGTPNIPASINSVDLGITQNSDKQSQIWYPLLLGNWWFIVVARQWTSPGGVESGFHRLLQHWGLWISTFGHFDRDANRRIRRSGLGVSSLLDFLSCMGSLTTTIRQYGSH